MRVIAESFKIKTTDPLQLINLTEPVRGWLRAARVRDGLLHLFSLHTSAGLLLTEFPDAVPEDVRTFLRKMADEGTGQKPKDPAFTAGARSHLRSLLVEQSLSFPVVGGEVVLGRSQSLLYVELDGPQERRLQVQVIGS